MKKKLNKGPRIFFLNGERAKSAKDTITVEWTQGLAVH